MKKTTYICDRCEKDCGIDGNKVYSERLKIVRNENNITQKYLELCNICALKFDDIFFDWLYK